MASVDMHDIDLKEFNEVLAACKGDVFMVTPEGDRKAGCASSSALPS